MRAHAREANQSGFDRFFSVIALLIALNFRAIPASIIAVALDGSPLALS
jgi:hypothetical protein